MTEQQFQVEAGATMLPIGRQGAAAPLEEWVPMAEGGAHVEDELERQVSLCEVLDRVLTKGVVIKGDVVISVADVDLLYLGVQLLLCSAETAERIDVWRRRSSGFRIKLDDRLGLQHAASARGAL